MGQVERVALTYILTMCKTQLIGSSCIAQGAQLRLRKGIKLGRGGRETQEGVDIGILMAVSHSCTAETNTTG